MDYRTEFLFCNLHGACLCLSYIPNMLSLDMPKGFPTGVLLALWFSSLIKFILVPKIPCMNVMRYDLTHVPQHKSHSPLQLVPTWRTHTHTHTVTQKKQAVQGENGQMIWKKHNHLNWVAVSPNWKSGWWVQPIWKILVKFWSFPQVGVKIKMFETTT